MRKIKKYALDLVCKYLLVPKSRFAFSSSLKTINCSSNEIEILSNTSNNVIRIQTAEGNLYFRECKRHKEIHEYVSESMDFYYTRLKPEHIEDRDFIKNKLTCKSNFKKFVNMGMTNDKLSGIYRFCMGEGAHCIGLDGMSPDMEERVKGFAQFIWGDLFAYQLNSGLKIGEYQTYGAVRSIATYRMSKLLGLNGLIPKTECANLFIDGEFACFGTVMEEAVGFSVEAMDEEKKAELSSPTLQRLLNNLNLLDVFCLEKDHRPGNYHVVAAEGKITGVSAFDNDSPNSFGIGKISFETYLGCSPWTINNQMNRPYVDADVARRIMEITPMDLQKTFGDILNMYQTITIKSRLRKVQSILSKTPKNKWLDKEEWSQNTIKEELSGAYGTTYLGKFLENYELQYQPWITKDDKLSLKNNENTFTQRQT